MRRSVCFWLLLPLTMASGLAYAGNPWEELMGRKKQVWTEPQGRFSLDMPFGWSTEPKNAAPNVVDLWGKKDNGAQARMSVEIRRVPPKTRLSHFASQILDDAKRAAHRFNLISTDRSKVAGRTAHRQLFSYQVRDHAQLVNEVVQVMFIEGDQAYVITLETVFGQRAFFWDDFELMMSGFSTGAGHVQSVSSKGKRKRIRAGEMVNPDALEY